MTSVLSGGSLMRTLMALLVGLCAIRIPTAKANHARINSGYQFATPPGVFIWSNDFEEFNPYDLLESDMLGEYVLGAIRPDKSTEFQIMFFNPSVIPCDDGPGSRNHSTKTQLLQVQNIDKEYYWAFFNQTGVLPSVVWMNTTVRSIKEFGTTHGNTISFNFQLDEKMFHSSRLPLPPFDIKIEIPANSQAWLTKRTFLELPSWGLLRWRLSDAPLVTWSQIKSETALANNSMGTLTPAPEFFRKFQNPCALDLFAFYMMTSRNGSTKLYIHVPILPDDRWIDLSPAFCSQVVNTTNATISTNNKATTPVQDCGTLYPETPIVLTNDHILALTSTGIFVSDPLSGSDGKYEDSYLLRPLLEYKLIDPRVHLSDIVTCFGTQNSTQDIKIHYTPVCHLYQHPNYKDTVILVLKHSLVVQNTSISNSCASANVTAGPSSSAFTIIFADAPYGKWEILLKSVHEYGNYTIVDIPGIFFNHHQNHFDLAITIKSPNDTSTKSVRVVLPRPLTKSAYYTELSGIPERGFQSFMFDPDFRLKRMQVHPGSMDVFYYGNHLWISESGGFLIYQSLGEIEGGSEIKDCSFGHPDRYYVCTNQENSILLLGRIGSFYSPVVMYPHEAREIRELAEKKKWMLPIDKNWDQTKKSVYTELNNARLMSVLRNAHFTVTYGGRLLMWYMRDAEISDKIQPETATLWNMRPVIKSRSYDQSIAASAKAEYKQAAKSGTGTGPAATTNAAEKGGGITRVEVELAQKSFVSRAKDGPLVPMPIDAVSCVLFEAKVPDTNNTATALKPTYLNDVHVGLNIRCSTESNDDDDPENCELYIRHIKNLRGYLDGFKSSALAFVVNPIPMRPYHCAVKLHINVKNSVQLDLFNNTLPSAGDCWNDAYVGWTLFIPGECSVLLEGVGVNATNCNCTSCTCVEGLAIKQTLQPFVKTYPPYASLLIDMSTPMYKKAQQLLRNTATADEKVSWELELGDCTFVLLLLPNYLIKESGGHVIMDLHDTVTFKIRLVAANEMAQVMMQRPLLRISNSNPVILQVDRDYVKTRKHQELTVVVRPTGFGIGISTVVIRTVGCSMKCETPCSFTIIFQLMRQDGRDLTIDYPAHVSPKHILNPDRFGNVHDSLGNVIYKRLPVNYRPPSHRGPDIPLSEHIYNSDPSKPRYHDWYRVSKQTGTYKKCKGADKAAGCNCTETERLSDHPDFTDCKQMVYVVRRGEPVKIRVRYKPLLNDFLQDPTFFLKKTHLSITLQEINDRAEYSVTSKSDEYLRQINADRDLNLGRRYYDANSLKITCYGTGVFHFRAVLGRFDSFDHVLGYFILYSEENGMSSLMYLVVFLLTLTACFVGLFFAFLHIRGRLLANLPLLREEAPLVEDRVERQKKLRAKIG